ncbi:MAG: antibiotic biosynthesis monooxygenase, partial [Steroidobacteraceae bacterium]|nr:antibiotic biosynthesis monooxygenase [Steroidobacteraceae bacterium]
VVRDGLVDDAVRLSQEHVHRSRAEPGCIAHAVHQDCENPARLVFVEEWTDDVSLTQHFKVPASRTFVAELSAMAIEPPTMTIYSAERVGP